MHVWSHQYCCFRMYNCNPVVHNWQELRARNNYTELVDNFDAYVEDKFFIAEARWMKNMLQGHISLSSQASRDAKFCAICEEPIACMIFGMRKTCATCLLAQPAIFHMFKEYFKHQ